MSTKDNTLRLDEENKIFLGVCSGFARYLDAPVAIVRLSYCIACLIWPTLTIVYFVMYWVLKTHVNPGKLTTMFTESKTAEHFRNLDYKRKLYRNPDDIKIAGVCSGIADYLEISPFVVRLITFLSFFIFGPFTFWAYIVMWIILQKRPAGFSYKQNAGFKDEVFSSEVFTKKAGKTDKTEKAPDARSLRECANLLNKTELRLREAEAFITSTKFRLHCEINRI